MRIPIQSYSVLFRLFPVVLGIFLFNFEIHAQPSLIPNDPGNNIYAITFTDIDQKIISIEFDEDITVLGNTSGWTITVGGVPVSIFGPIFEPSNHKIIQFQLASAISYANRNSVFVTYNQAVSSITQIGWSKWECSLLWSNSGCK